MIPLNTWSVCLVLSLLSSVLSSRDNLKPCNEDEDCSTSGENLICLEGTCYPTRDIGEDCEVNGQCTDLDQNRKCQKKKCSCIRYFKYNETSNFCEEQGCLGDNDCEGALICRNHKCLVRGVPSPYQPSPEAVFVVVAAILGGIVTITVSVVVIKSGLFKRSRRKSTLNRDE